MPKTESEYLLLIDVVRSELKSKYLFYLTPDREKYYDNSRLISDNVKLAFPTAAEELMLAGNCYAVDLNTACVYHCMRALERGLKALAKDVDLTWTTEQWQKIINDIEGAVKALGNTLQKGQAKNERLQFLSEAAKEFTWFKDGWRNYTAHAKTSYRASQALTLMEHVTAFMGVLSQHLKEAP